MYKGRRIFRSGPGMLLLFVALTVLFALGAVFTYRTNGWGFTSIGLALASVVLGIGSIVEQLLLRIEITDDALIVSDLRGRRRYEIADIERVGEAKGAPTAVQLRDGRWVKLPQVGDNVGNSIRSWLRQSRGTGA